MDLMESRLLVLKWPAITEVAILPKFLFGMSIKLAKKVTVVYTPTASEFVSFESIILSIEITATADNPLIQLKEEVEKNSVLIFLEGNEILNVNGIKFFLNRNRIKSITGMY